MISIVRNAIMAFVVVMIAGANIYTDVLNPFVACAIALAAGWFTGRAIEHYFIERAHDEMRHLYGDDWR